MKTLEEVLANLRTLRAAASPGPWLIEKAAQNHTGEPHDMTAVIDRHRLPVLNNQKYYPHAVSEANAVYIVALHALVERLLDQA